MASPGEASFSSLESIRPEIQGGPGLAPEAGMGGGEYIPLQNSLPPPRALFPPPWVMKLLRQDGLVGRDRWQRHGMQGRSVPAAGTVHLSLQPPPPLLGAELGSRFSPRRSQWASHQGARH